jgi:predicted protein tyrosine phosphatase
MRVHVLSKLEFDKIMEQHSITDKNVEKFDSIMFISIIDTQCRRDPWFKENHENVMNLRFDDVEHDGEASPTQEDSTRAFSEAQAAELYEFIKRNREKETCIVHCHAGISRSAGCGLFVNDYTKGDIERFKRDNPQISPNQRVFRMLKNEWFNDL